MTRTRDGCCHCCVTADNCFFIILDGFALCLQVGTLFHCTFSSRTSELSGTQHNTIAGNCHFFPATTVCSLDPSLCVALHWQVCSQCDARFCCAMLSNAKSPAGGQQPSFMLHYSDRVPLSLCLALSHSLSSSRSVSLALPPL